MIKEVIKGQSPSLLDSGKANELIRAINGILKSSAADPLSLQVDGDGKISVSMDASPLAGNIVVNGVITKKIIFVQNPESDEE